MKDKYKNLFKDILIFALGNIGSKLLLFLMVPLYTNYLSPEEYGTSELIFTLSQLLLPFVSFVIFDAVIRFGLSKQYQSEDVLLCALIVAAVGGLITVGITPFLEFYGEVSHWKWYLCILLILSIVEPIELNYLKICDKNKTYAIISVTRTFVVALLSIIFLTGFQMGIRGYLLANIIGAFVSCTMAFFVGALWNALKKAKFQRMLLKEMLAFSAPLILNNVSWWVVQSSNKILVNAVLGAAALGIFTVATKIPSLINVLITIFSQAWGLSAVKEIEETQETSFYSDVLACYQTIAFGAAVFLIAIIKPFMSVYVSSEFQDAWKYVPLLLVGASFSALAVYFASVYSALKKSLNNMISALIGAGINIGLSLLLISRFGIFGAAIGTCVSYGAVSVLRMLDIWRLIKMRMSTKSILLNACIVLIQSIAVSIDFYPLPFSICAVILFVIVNKKIIITLFKTILPKHKI